MRFIYLLLILLLALPLISCGNTPEIFSTPSSKNLTVGFEKQLERPKVKSIPTKPIRMTPLTSEIKVTDSRNPTIFPPPSGDREFPLNLQEEFKNIVDAEFSVISEKAGISVAVYTDGILWTYSSGKASESIGMTTNTPLMISSTSKTFLSALILTQIENGLYELNDTLDFVLLGHPDFSSLPWDKINPQVTIHELMTMSSGLPDYNENMQGKSDLTKKPELTPIDLINLIQSQHNEQGTFKYNDTNVVFLGMIAELHSGQTLAELYRQTFFEPLSITAITLPEEGIEWHSKIIKDSGVNFSLPAMAMPYMDISRWSSGFGNMIDAAPFGFAYYIGAIGRTRFACCGIVSTPENIARWAYHLYSTDGLAISESIRTQLKSSTSPTRIPPWSSSKVPDRIPAEYGYLVSKKIFHDKKSITTTYGHPGGGGGYSGWMHYSPELDLAVSIMTNSEMKFLGTCRTEGPGNCIAMAIFKIYKEKRPSN